MKKTFVTVMPNHIGAFLKASKCFAANDVNITRVSYNKAVDSHTLFIDAEGNEKDLLMAAEELKKIGYLQVNENVKSVVLLEFRLRDVPGSVTDILQLISEYNLNISYISSQENGTEYQFFKMGIVSCGDDKINEFISEAEKICPVEIIDPNHPDKNYDNSLFYMNFVNSLSSLMDISDNMREELLINANLAMQRLDETGVSPYRTFESISRFCELLSASRGENFKPRVSVHKITDNTDIILIEPQCGSNTAIIRSFGEYLFIDTGYAYCSTEMNKLFKILIPEFYSIKKQVFVTHADVDHCGLLPEFDIVYAGKETAKSLRTEFEGKGGFREQNPLHKPYIQICKILTSYQPVNPGKVICVGHEPESDGVLAGIGNFVFGELHFELYQGRGGHLPGETVLIDYDNHIVFSGDIFVNLKDMTREQAKYNKFAPILMTSVDTDPKLCTMERQAIFSRLGVGSWQIFGGHGGKKTYNVEMPE